MSCRGHAIRGEDRNLLVLDPSALVQRSAATAPTASWSNEAMETTETWCATELARTEVMLALHRSRRTAPRTGTRVVGRQPAQDFDCDGAGSRSTIAAWLGPSRSAPSSELDHRRCRPPGRRRPSASAGPLRHLRPTVRSGRARPRLRGPRPDRLTPFGAARETDRPWSSWEGGAHGRFHAGIWRTASHPAVSV